MAPGLGLYLSELFFEGYNSKQHRAIQHSVAKQQSVSAGPAESARKKQKTDEVAAPVQTAVEDVGHTYPAIWIIKNTYRYSTYAFTTTYPHVLFIHAFIHTYIHNTSIAAYIFVA